MLDSMLPPLVDRPCSKLLQEKFNKLLVLKKRGVNIVKLMQSHKSFRNPYYVEKFFQTSAFSLEESGTSFLKGLHHPALWNENSMYMEIDSGEASPEIKSRRANMLWSPDENELKQFSTIL